MIFLVLSVLFSTTLLVVFKYFELFKIDTLKAIVVNYIVAFTLGMISTPVTISLVGIPQKEWFYGAIFLGLLFIFIFFVMAKTAQNNGVSVASVSGKMSVVIPIFFGVFLYNESVTLLKTLGILVALTAVYLASVKDNEVGNQQNSLLFPFLLFIGSGIIDTSLKYIEVNFVPKDEVDIFSGFLFGFAAIFGGLALVYAQLKNKSIQFGWKNLLAGIVLGVPNYYSIVFLIKALQTKGIESSTLFTINNVAIVITSTIVGLLLFKEQFSLKNKIGVLLAVVGILLVSIA